MSHLHVPDGVLPVWLVLAGWGLAGGLLLLASRMARRAEVQRKVPLLGAVSALMLIAMSSEIVPIAYHINLSVVGGALLGPWLSIVAAFVVDLILALLGHGGVTVAGLNSVILATEMIVGWALFRSAVAMLDRQRTGWAAAGATVIALLVSTTMLVGIVALARGGQAARRETGAFDVGRMRFANPFGEGLLSVRLLTGGEGAEGALDLSVRRFATVVYTLGPIGWVIEALITAGVLGYVARVRPSLILERVPARPALPGHAGHGEARQE